MKDFVEYLERMIEGCDSLGGMEREKATYQSVLKEYRKQCNIANVVGQSEQLPDADKHELEVTNKLLNERQRVLDAIPECPSHGKCVPHAIEWVEEMKAKHCC